MSQKDGEVFMQSLRDRVEAAIREALHKQGHPEAAKTAKREAGAVMVSLWLENRGDQIYMPLKSSLLHEALCEELASGVPAGKLATKYGIAYSTVYKIYKADLAKKREPKQAMLPGV